MVMDQTRTMLELTTPPTSAPSPPDGDAHAMARDGACDAGVIPTAASPAPAPIPFPCSDGDERTMA